MSRFNHFIFGCKKLFAIQNVSEYKYFMELSGLSEKCFAIKLGLVFPVVMYGCESWTVKKAKCQRIDAFKQQS